MTRSVESSDPPHRARGRPRSAAVEEAILRATIELLAELGPEGTTINAVADRSKVARATIYLRWPGRDALIAATLRHAIGRPPIELSGNIETDLQRVVEQARAVLAQPLMHAVMPVLIHGFLQGDQGPSGLAYATLFPRRSAFADEYRREAGHQGLRTDVAGELVVDLIVGALLNQLLASGKPPTTRFARQVVDVLISGLRRDA